MIRIVIEETDFGTAAHVEGVKATRKLKSFDVELPELEKYLREIDNLSWRTRQLVGVELLE